MGVPNGGPKWGSQMGVPNGGPKWDCALKMQQKILPGLSPPPQKKKPNLVLMYRKLSLSIIDNFAIFWIIGLSVFLAKNIDNSR
jgi:hypothetical protein